MAIFFTRVYWINLAAFLMTCTNWIFSLALIALYWESFRSITVLLTNGVLIMTMLWSSLNVLRNKQRPTASCLRFDAFAHNIIDADRLASFHKKASPATVFPVL